VSSTENKFKIKYKNAKEKVAHSYQTEKK